VYKGLVGKKDERERARLDWAIDLFKPDNPGIPSLVLVQRPAGRKRLLGWLTELRERRAESARRSEAETMKTLTGFYGLTEEEARRIWSNLLKGIQPEYEKGKCRKCGGRGRVENFVRSTCTGNIFDEEECFTCRGTGTDPKRIKVPPAEATA
jgi:hypothetical protein